MPLLTFNESVKRAIEISQSLAKEYHNEFFSSAHLLRSLMHKDVGLKNFIESIGKDGNYITEWAEIRMENCPKVAKVKDIISGDEGVKRVFDEADNMRIKLGLDLISPVCVLAALSKPGIGFSSEQLKSFPIKEKELLEVYFKESDIQNAVTESSQTAEKKTTGALFKYCVDRIALAKENKTDPIIGRDMETRMMMEILCRRTKPNVIVIGEAGVGKTALIDGFAMDIANNKVPSLLTNSQLFELDLGLLVAGASYKGEIEDRLKNIIKEVKQYQKAIIFIDEIHVLLDEKGSIGGGAANLLKPELARGEITVIGATTTEEYRKNIEPDQAFTRRFEVLPVAEPGIDATIKMLDCIAPKFEKHHQLKIEKGAIQECIRLSKRYVKDRRLPDVAIDLLDRTMAAIKLMKDTNKNELDDLRTRLVTLKEEKEFSEQELFNEYKWLNDLMKAKISPVLLGKLENASQTDKFETSVEFDNYLKKSFEELEKLADAKKETISKDDIAAVISYKTGIPIGNIQAQEQERLLHMDDYLRKRVVGQDKAIEALTGAILESRADINKAGLPIGSFFFLGPTGTGKTELAKSLAEFLFSDEKAMIRFDMSEFQEKHSAELLLGAPPGYVGYKEGGLLINKIRETPYSVVLFDEIEKAHPDAFQNIFLPLLDEGRLADRLGKEGDFSNAVIIFTSNISSKWIADQFTSGKVPTSNDLRDRMKENFKPEFLARLTEIVPFAPITEKNVVRIFEIQMKSLLDALLKKGISFSISEEAKKFLAFNGFTPEFGARQIAGEIRNQLRRPISKYIISGELKKGNTVKINLNGEKLDWLIE